MGGVPQRAGWDYARLIGGSSYVSGFLFRSSRPTTLLWNLRMKSKNDPKVSW